MTDHDIVALQDKLQKAEETLIPGIYKVELTHDEINFIVRILDEREPDE